MLKISTYRKVTFTGVLTNYLSFTPISYKIGLVKCLIDRVFKVNNTWMGFHVDLKHVCCILKRNCFPEHILNRVTNNYLNSKYVNIPTAWLILIPYVWQLKIGHFRWLILIPYVWQLKIGHFRWLILIPYVWQLKIGHFRNKNEPSKVSYFKLPYIGNKNEPSKVSYFKLPYIGNKNEPSKVSYFKLPYIGKASVALKFKIKCVTNIK